LVVIVDKVGQLGNRLFHFAHFIAFGEAYGVRIANPGFEDFANYFPAFSEDALCRYPAVRSPIPATERTRDLAFRIVARLARASRSPLRILRLEPGETCELRASPFREEAERRRLLLVEGWLFRDDASFAEHANLLRSVFTPTDAHCRRVEQVVAAARRDVDVLVGLHMRRGDYATYLDGRHFHQVDEYRAVMDAVRALFLGRSVGFLVCTDEADSRDALVGPGVAAGPAHLVEDLYALARCDYLIGPPSTYSAWASFYGQVPLHHFRDPGRPLALGDFTVRGG
jgi:hypothetical protein